jgi:alpha-N-arabinofuranosidase
MMYLQRTKQFIILFVAAMVLNGFGQNTVTFNVDGATAVVAHEVFGLLMERLGRQWTNNGIFVGTSSTISNTNGMRNDVIDGFKECGVGAVQWPGGCAANGYSWSSNKKPSNDVGVDRFIQFCKLTGAEVMISGKPTGNDAASNLAFAQYIIDSLDYPLKWFKVGNEVWGGCGTNYASGYTTGFNTNVDKLNTLKSKPNGKDLKYIAAAGAMEGTYSWIPTHYSSMGNTMNAIEYHDYIYFPKDISSSNPTTANYWTIMNAIFVGDFHSHLFTNIIPAMKAADPSSKVKICFDEWGNWLKNTGDGWMQDITVMDAIGAGGHLNQFIQNADIVGAACLAQGVNVIQSIININTSGVMVKTPTFYVFKLYKPHHANGAKSIPITASAFENANGSVPAISAAASVDAGGFVNVSLTNCDLSATRKVTVTLTSSHAEYRVVSAEVVTGSEYTTTNPFGNAEQVNIQPLAASTYSVSGKTLTVTMPKTSVVMIRLLPTDVAVQPGSLKNRRDAYSIAAGPHGTVFITSPANRNTPVTVSLYGIDGRTLMSRTSRTFDAGGSTIVPGNEARGKGVCLVKLSGEGVNLYKHVVLAR